MHPVLTKEASSFDGVPNHGFASDLTGGGTNPLCAHHSKAPKSGVFAFLKVAPPRRYR
jgi:hypothetical protein